MRATAGLKSTLSSSTSFLQVSGSQVILNPVTVLKTVVQ
jgi:hypothetical protein